MMNVKIVDCFTVPAYRRVNSEEGPYDAHCGWNVIATSVGKCGRLFHWLYVGRKENPSADSHPAVCFGRESAAQAHVNRQVSAGAIDDQWWWMFDMQDPNELPDYVLHPERPEYN